MITAVKMVLGCITGVGIGTLTKEASKRLSPSEMNRFTKICIVVATSVIGGLVSKKAEEHISEQVDEAVGVIGKLKKSLNM